MCSPHCGWATRWSSTCSAFHSWKPMRRCGRLRCRVARRWLRSRKGRATRSKMRVRFPACRSSRLFAISGPSTRRIPRRWQASFSACSRSLPEHEMSAIRRIALIAGDGIGPEVTAVGQELLEWYRDERGLPLELWPLELGAQRWLATGEGLSDALLAEIRRDASAVLLGALGDPRIPGHEHARSILFGLRFGLD